MKNKSFILMFSAVMSFSATAESTAPPIYECTPAETASFIKASTFNLSTPSIVPTAEDLKTSYKELKIEEGDDNCLALLAGEISFDDSWKDLMDGLDAISGQYMSMSSAVLLAIDTAFKEVKAKVMEELNKGLCERLSEADLANMVNEIATERMSEATGVNMDDIRGSLDGLLEDKVLEMYGEDSKYFYDPDAISADQEKDAAKKIRTISDDFWDDI
jgi:hypothetical protein